MGGVSERVAVWTVYERCGRQMNGSTRTRGQPPARPLPTRVSSRDRYLMRGKGRQRALPHLSFTVAQSRGPQEPRHICLYFQFSSFFFRGWPVIHITSHTLGKSRRSLPLLPSPSSVQQRVSSMPPFDRSKKPYTVCYALTTCNGGFN